MRFRSERRLPGSHRQRPIVGWVSDLVPKGGLEPPHPCEYMDLNHARLPIPPLRQSGRVKLTMSL
jgi:hypothetical protein